MPRTGSAGHFGEVTPFQVWGSHVCAGVRRKEVAVS